MKIIKVGIRMDRKTAKQHIGKEVILNEGSFGKYTAFMEDMVTEPKKPWRALLRITGVYVYPDFNSDEIELILPYLKENDQIERPGKQIELLEEHFNYSYDESVARALKDKWDKTQEINNDTEIILSIIQQELRRLHSEHLIFEDSYVYYEIVVKGRNVHIYDKEKKESLSISGCPFEFEVELDGEWIPAVYISDLTFEFNQDKQTILKNGSIIRLNKSQFDPYRILLNELASPSLIALERGLQQLGIGHEHSVYCHNSLLIQLLSSFSKQSFKGVNFLSYVNEKKQILVQHHYERTIKDQDDDITYDRFEFTSDNGERVITTYATQFSGE